MNILFASSEVAPFAKTGGLGDVGSALPRALAAAGHDVRVIMPMYSRVLGPGRHFTEVIPELWLDLGGTRVKVSLYESVLPGTNVPVYFVRCPPLYDRPSLYGNSPDEHLRFAVLNWAALKACQVLRFAPDVIPCNDWQTSLIPLLLRARFSQDPKQPPTTRVARALSTYSRLDLTEPGLGEWIKRAVAASAPATQARFAAKDGRRLRLAVTAQGAGVDAEAFSRELTRVYGTLGVQVVKTAAKDADYVAKLAALDVRDEGGRTAVRVTMDLAAARGEEPRWRTTLFRTSLAANPKDALAASVDWLVRIGGRDLLFAWLDAQGLEGVKMQAPAGDGHGHHDHDGHDHGGSGRVPITGGAAPPRIQLDPGGRQPSPPPPAPAPR